MSGKSVTFRPSDSYSAIVSKANRLVPSYMLRSYHTPILDEPIFTRARAHQSENRNLNPQARPNPNFDLYEWRIRL